MLKYIVKRLLMLIPMLLVMSLFIFVAFALIPGDPADIIMAGNSHFSPELAAEIRKMLGLDLPLHVRYARFIWNAIHGDLGRSYHTEIPVIESILTAFPNTVELAFAAMAIAVMVGIPVGIIAAVKRNSVLDNVVRVIVIGGVSIPIFWLGLVLIYVFAVVFHWLPTSGKNGIEHLVLPAITLATYPIATIVRMTRNSMLDVLGHDYIRTARSKGLKERRVLIKHALKNAIIPVITIVGIQMGVMLGGAVLTETVFAWPGIGRLLISSLLRRDYPIAQGCVLMIVTVFLFVNLIVDILYVYVDPRIRFR